MYLDVAGVMLLVLNVDQTVSMINKKGCEILNYTEEEVVGKNWFNNFVPERIRKDVQTVFEQVIAGDISASEFYSNPVKTRDGSEKYISWHNSTIQNNDGKIVKILSSGEDITERMKAQNALKESEKRYREIVEATNAGIYEIDFINDKFIYVNDVMCKLTGWTREELLSMGPSNMLTQKSIEDWIIRWDALNKGDYIEKTFEYEAKIKDGSTVWTLVTAEYKENEEGMVVGARVIAIDITEAKRSREEVKKKEEYIFNELENRIHQWKNEITASSMIQENTIKDVNLSIASITNNVEVF
jgi:PAS domain S-box-containing protein